MRTALLWALTQRVVVISYRRLGTTYRVPSSRVKNTIRKIQDFLPLELGPIGYSETSVRTYHYSLRNNPEERGSRLEEKFEDNIKLENEGNKFRTNGDLKLRETVIRKVKKQMLKLQ